EELIAAGQFREDLYYRINLITLKIPALRERRADIPLLVAYFVENLKTIYHRPDLTVDAGAVRWLSDLPWPGNVRELKNLVERTVLVSAGDRLTAKDFQTQLHPLGRSAGQTSLPAVGTMTIEAMEVSMIRKALEFHGSNLTRVARSLGLSRAALYRRMEKHGITV
ncbi:MAG: helix-turn-helix domain-containing protein, partial [Candidatus Zixiibacteriota bacterium]